MDLTQEQIPTFRIGETIPLQTALAAVVTGFCIPVPQADAMVAVGGSPNPHPLLNLRSAIDNDHADKDANNRHSDATPDQYEAATSELVRLSVAAETGFAMIHAASHLLTSEGAELTPSCRSSTTQAPVLQLRKALVSLPIPLNSYSQGYALCTPAREIVGHTYRSTAADAVEAFSASGHPSSAVPWEELQALGWTVEFVYAHVFKPVFHPSQSVAQDTDIEVDE